MRSARQSLGYAVALPVGAGVVGGLAFVLPAVVPVLLIIALASIVRVGDSVFDRVMTAVAISVGTLCVAALGFSVWPWGFDPVAVSLSAWGGIWMLAMLTRRRPAFPRPSVPDLAVVAAAVIAFLPAWPVLRTNDFGERLALVMIGEDNSRHMMWWSGIRDSATYLFMAGDRFPDVVIEGTGFYPQGWHVTAAILDTFVGGVEGPGPAEMDRYLLWMLITNAYLVLSVVWLATVTVRKYGSLQALAAATVCAALVTGGELFRMLVHGYPAEALGISMVASAVAVVALTSRRESATVREPALVLAATFVATSFAYYVFLVPLALFGAVWLWRHRREAARTPVLLVVALVITAFAAAVMPYIGVTTAVDAGALNVGGDGDAIWFSLTVLIGLAAMGVLLTDAWSEPGVRWTVLAGACFAGFAVALVVVFQSGYYVHKILHVTIAVTTVLCASAVLRIPARAGREGRVRAAVPLVGVAVASVVGAGLTGWAPGLFTNPSVGTSNYGVWRNDFWSQTATATTVQQAIGLDAAKPGTTTWVTDSNPYLGYHVNLFVSLLQGTSNEMRDVYYTDTFTQPERLIEQLDTVDGDVRILAKTPEEAAWAQSIVDQQGDTERARVVNLAPPVEELAAE